MLRRGGHSQARAAVAGERDRIIRELHDLVTHSITVMTVLAAAERRGLGDRHAESTGRALGEIERIGHEALVEMRRLIAMLRQDDDEAALLPQPSLAGLDQLLEQLREGGLEVELRIEGEPAPLAPGLDLTVYRIIQESLASGLGNGDLAHARVTVSYLGGALELEVREDREGEPDAREDRDGNPLIAGLRERAELFGGALSVAGDAGGQALRARFPLGGSR